jgi:hypothetical protein
MAVLDGLLIGPARLPHLEQQRESPTTDEAGGARLYTHDALATVG